MTRTELEDAIKQLSHLLDEDESAEEKYQQYFEENLIVFKVLGFSHAYPKLALPRSGGGSYKPDFLLERLSIAARCLPRMIGLVFTTDASAAGFRKRLGMGLRARLG